jgi:hypothetical protein
MEAGPKALGRPERPQPPPEQGKPAPPPTEQVKPASPPTGGRPGTLERRGKPLEAEPKAKGRPERPQPPPEQVKPAPPPQGGRPGTVEQRGKPLEAEPKAKGRPERPQGIPADNVRPEDREKEEGRGNRR